MGWHQQPLQNIVIHKKAFIQNTTLSNSYKILKVKCDLQLFHMYIFTACMSSVSLKGVSVFILMRNWTCQIPATGACTLVCSYNFTRGTLISFVHFISPAAAQRPCSTNRAAPYRWPSASLHCSATSAPGPGIHLKGETEWDGESKEVCSNNDNIIHVSSRLRIVSIGCNMLPSAGTWTEAHPAGDHRYSLPFPVHSAKRGRLGSHWKQRTADVCSSTACKLIFCRSQTHTAVTMLSAGRETERESKESRGWEI